jgi:hypothetical protein
MYYVFKIQVGHERPGEIISNARALILVFLGRNTLLEVSFKHYRILTECNVDNKFIRNIKQKYKNNICQLS